MSKFEAITRCSLILKKIEKHPCSFKEISDYLEKESVLNVDFSFTVSKRTFQRDLDEIRNLFQTDIKFDFSKKVYFIAEKNGNKNSERLLEAFDTFNALHLTDGITPYLHFKKRRPQGTEHFYGLLHAIKNTLVIKFNYFKLYDGSFSERILEPLFLKETQRWYIIGKDTMDNTIKTFCLDRITDLEITNKKYQTIENVEIENMFQYAFGIIDDFNLEPQKIVLRFTKFQGQYIKSYPFHVSQKVTEAEDHVLVELYIKITHDFIMELLSLGGTFIVLEPTDLKKTLIEMHQQAINELSNNLHLH